MHSHKAKPDKINDKHGSSLPSINEYFGLLLYFSSKSPFAQLFSYMKKMAHFQEVFEFITALTDCFDVFSQMLLCHTVAPSPAQAFFIE